MPPSAPNAEPAAGEQGSRSISPAPAPGSAPTATARSERGRPPPRPRAQSPAAPAGAALHPLRAPLQGRERGAVSPRSARCSGPGSPRAPPPLRALHPRGLPRSGLCAGSSRSSRARGSQHRAPLPQPQPLPPRTPALLTSRRAQGASGRSPRPQPPPPTSGPASAAQEAAAPAQALGPPPRRAFPTPGSRRFPARHAQRARPRSEGARARGREVSGLEAGTRRRERATGAWLPPGEGRGVWQGPAPQPPGSLPAGETRPPRAPPAPQLCAHLPGRLGAPPDVTPR